jgi:hypothetical protein
LSEYPEQSHGYGDRQEDHSEHFFPSINSSDDKLGNQKLNREKDDHVDAKYKPIACVSHPPEIIIPFVNEEEEIDNDKGGNKG